LGVISSDPSDFFDSDLSTILVDISVDVNVDGFSDGLLDDLNDIWDDGALQVWDESSGNFGGESTGKGDIDISWVNLDDRFLYLEKWGLLRSNLLL